jgi:uncharacterized protein
LGISLFHVLEFVLIGTLVGFLGGYLGIGGGAVMIALLNYWVFPSLGVSPEVIIHLCFGTTLAIIIPSSIAGSLAQARVGNVNWRIVSLLTLPGILGSFLGTTIAAYLPSHVLRPLFGILLILISAQMFWQKKGSGDTPDTSSPPQPSTVLMVGAVVGLFSGLFGLGGGVIAIPLLVKVLRLPIHQAVGNSIALVMFTSLIGTAGYVFHGWGDPNLPPHSLGYVHIPGWILAGIPSIFLSGLGVKLARETKPLRLRRVFALVLGAVGIRMVLS